MSDIVYLTKKDRDRLSEIEQQIGVRSPEMEQERLDIMAKRKTLGQMTVQECNHMKVEINQKIQKITQMGRIEHVRPFLVMIAALNGRIETIMLNPEMKAEQNAATIRANREKARKANPLARPVRSRWASRASNGTANDPPDDAEG